MANYENEYEVGQEEEYIEAFYNDPSYSEEYGVDVGISQDRIEGEVGFGFEQPEEDDNIQEFDTFGEDFETGYGLGEDINTQQPDFQVGYSERDRFTSGTNILSTGSKEEIYLFKLKELISNRGEYLKEYLPVIKKIPRWYLKNPDLLIAAVDMYNSLEENKGRDNNKPKNDLISAELKKQVKNFGGSLQQADILRYYRLIIKYF